MGGARRGRCAARTWVLGSTRVRRAPRPGPALDREALLRRVTRRSAFYLAVPTDQDEGWSAADAVGLEGAAQLVDRDGGGEGAGELREERVEPLGGLVGD